MTEAVLIPHIDDVGGSHGANVAMIELGRSRAVTSGSVMVPPAWFPELVAEPHLDELDLGIHLTLTSEPKAFRWRPLSTASPASGLFDDAGYMWPTVPELRRHAHPEAVEGELRTQVEMAKRAGIEVSHLDHHMGAALSPEFVEGTVDIATDYGIPLLFPSDLESYLAVLNMGPLDLEVLEEARRRAGALAIGDTFLMPLAHQDDPDPRATLERLLSGLAPGMTYLSLHCASPGDVEQIHPGDAHWRIAEYEVFSDPGFRDWIQGQPFRLTGLRRSSA